MKDDIWILFCKDLSQVMDFYYATEERAEAAIKRCDFTGKFVPRMLRPAFNPSLEDSEDD